VGCAIFHPKRTPKKELKAGDRELALWLVEMSGFSIDSGYVCFCLGTGGSGLFGGGPGRGGNDIMTAGIVYVV